MSRTASFGVIATALAAIWLTQPATAKTIHVDQQHPSASDENSGAVVRPLKTIGRAAAIVRPGDTVLVHGGVYRETVTLRTSGTEQSPICFAAQPGDVVTITGAEPVEGPWSVDQGSICKTHVSGPVRQLFLDGQAMVEARWPNCPPERLWDTTCWAKAGLGSRYGKMVDPQLAATGLDLTGAIAVLNVAHQFYSWTRPVDRHAAGSDTFEYAKDLDGITSYADKTKQWEDDRYYLFGKLDALDSPGEWHYDAGSETLYFWPPDGDDPGRHVVERKDRDYGLVAGGLEHVAFRGFHFFGCAFALTDADHVTIEGCHFLYPALARRLDEKGFTEDGVGCQISGRWNTVRQSSFAIGSTFGLKIQGQGNLVEDNLVHDFCWNGSLKFVGLSLSGKEPADDGVRNIARHNTLFNMGNAVINYRGPGNVVEYNHVYDGGLCCKDVALVYTGQPDTAGNVVRYNWVHGCRTEETQPGGLQGGLGIRGDDQTRGLTVHHNVVWDCGRDGIIFKGDDNRVLNNTVFDIGTPDKPGNYVNLHTDREPEKWWRKQFPLLPVQNANSLIANNAALTIAGDNKGMPYPFEKNLLANYQGRDLKLVDPAGMDFRPRDDSPLVDAGAVVAGYADGYVGAAPDVGAYEHGQPRWLAGHRNALRVLVADGQAARSWEICIALAMPIFEPLSVSVTASSPAVVTSQTRLEFTPRDWMQPRLLAVHQRRQETLPPPGVDAKPNFTHVSPEAPDEIRLTVTRFGLDETLDLNGPQATGGLKLSFPAVP
jgi:hypothetical protein